MARNYRIQKRREKRNSFSTSMRISYSGRRVRASPSLHGDPAGGNWRIFHGTSVPRVTARIDAKDILRERKRGRIRLEVAQPGVIEAIKEPIISLSPRLKRVNSSIYITRISLLLPLPLFLIRYIARCTYILQRSIDRFSKKTSPLATVKKSGK